MTRARVKAVFKQSDYPGVPDDATQKDLAVLFEHLFPGPPDSKREPNFGYAILAQNPRLALHISKTADYIVREMPWSQRRDLRELVIQTLNIHYKCDFSFQAHLPLAKATGIA